MWATKNMRATWTMLTSWLWNYKIPAFYRMFTPWSVFANYVWYSKWCSEKTGTTTRDDNERGKVLLTWSKSIAISVQDYPMVRVITRMVFLATVSRRMLLANEVFVLHTPAMAPYLTCSVLWHGKYSLRKNKKARTILESYTAESADFENHLLAETCEW